MTNTQITTHSLNILMDEELLIAQELLYRCTPLLDEELTSDTIDNINVLEKAICERFSTATPAVKTTHQRAA